MQFTTWQRMICEEWFSSHTAFAKFILGQELSMPSHLENTLTIKAMAIFMRYGLALRVEKCHRCGGSAKLEMRSSKGWTTYAWTCATVGHKHMETQVNCHGFLSQFPINSWMPLLYFFNSLRLGRCFSEVRDEMVAGFGAIGEPTFRRWRDIYQETLGKYLRESGSLKIGGPNEIVVIDETVVGVHADDGWSADTKTVNKSGARAPRTTPRSGSAGSKRLIKKGVVKRLPARTYYRTQMVQKNNYVLKMKPGSVMKRPAGVKKRPANTAVKKRPATNLKSNGKWLWLGVLVGKGKQLYTHANMKKKLTFRIMPAKGEAIRKRPRGLEEMTATLREHVHPKSMVVYDGWTSTDSAVKRMGYCHPPPVKHDFTYRDATTGFHTNDAESENARLKTWSRHRYRRMMLNEREMAEYVFYINEGKTVVDLMRGLASGSGEGACKNKFI